MNLTNAERRAAFTPPPLGPWTVLARVLRLGWRYRWWFLGSLTVSAASAAIFSWLLVAIDRLFRAWSAIENADLIASDELNDAYALMDSTALTLLALAVPAAAAGYGAYLIGQRLANACIRDLRLDFVTQLVQLDLGFHSTMEKGDLLARLMDDLGNLRSMVQRVYGRLLQRPIELFVIVGYVWYINWRLGVFALVCMIPVALVLMRVIGKIKRRSEDERVALASNVVTFEQIVSGVRVIKTMGSAQRERDRFVGSNQELFLSQMKVAKSRAQSEAVTYGSIFALVAGFLWLGNSLFAGGHVSPSDMMVTLAALGRMTSNVRELQHAVGEVVQHTPAAERVFAVLDQVPSIPDDPAKPDCPEPKEAISLENVGFRYSRDDEEVLRDLSLRVPIGDTVALVGPSGGGKSTILDLVVRLYDVTSGAVCWDGTDVRELRSRSVIGHCAIVGQDAFLFDDTVIENIRYGRPDATRDEVETAAKRAHLHDDILRLEGGAGYETRVGDRGSRLSGGQRQRVAIARALLRDAPVLLLDEPTSALDADSESHVQAALEELMRGRTTIMIAHRLATVRHATTIHVLAGKTNPAQRGKIVESGTHEELVKMGGIYAKMAAQQSLDIEPLAG
ncbi:MAG: ABC transporter ATP-binding protein [Planctomycetota bacterium]|nr:ABC transporter ATP-binding protein [Planctomycetota bacterium]